MKIRKRNGASFISVLIFMVVAATVIGELFLLLEWSHLSTIDIQNNSRTIRNLESQIEYGKYWLAANELSKLPKPFVLDLQKRAYYLRLDSSKAIRFTSNANAKNLWIYNLSFDVQNANDPNNPPKIFNTEDKDLKSSDLREYYIEKFVATMSDDVASAEPDSEPKPKLKYHAYLLRAAADLKDGRVIVESIVSRDTKPNASKSDPAKIHEIMRQEIWY